MAQTALGSDSIGTKLPNWFLTSIVGAVVAIGGFAVQAVTGQMATISSDLHRMGERIAGLEQRVIALNDRLDRIEKIQDAQRSAVVRP